MTKLPTSVKCNPTDRRFRGVRLRLFSLSPRSPSERVGPKGRSGGAVPGRYASVSLGNRGLTNAQRLIWSVAELGRIWTN